MKLKTLLKETKAWDRKFGEPLPTLEDTTKAYALKQEDLNTITVQLSYNISNTNISDTIEIDFT